LKIKPIFITLTFSFLAFMDNLTTIYALQAGAYETNPLVAWMFTNPINFIIGTTLKCILTGAIIYYTAKKPNITTWLFISIIAFLYLRAIMINILNAI